jgi:hypothetical protein
MMRGDLVAGERVVFDLHLLVVEDRLVESFEMAGRADVDGQPTGRRSASNLSSAVANGPAVGPGTEEGSSGGEQREPSAGAEVADGTLEVPTKRSRAHAVDHSTPRIAPPARAP